MGSSEPVDFPKLTTYLLGAGAIIWLWTGLWSPLVVRGLSLYVFAESVSGTGLI